MEHVPEEPWPLSVFLPSRQKKSHCHAEPRSIFPRFSAPSLDTHQTTSPIQIRSISNQPHIPLPLHIFRSRSNPSIAIQEPHHPPLYLSHNPSIYIHKPSTMSKQYTTADVAQHKDEANGMWIIVDTGVYDITSTKAPFLDLHGSLLAWLTYYS